MNDKKSLMGTDWQYQMCLNRRDGKSFPTITHKWKNKNLISLTCRANDVYRLPTLVGDSPKALIRRRLLRGMWGKSENYYVIEIRMSIQTTWEKAKYVLFFVFELDHFWNIDIEALESEKIKALRWDSFHGDGD